MPFTYSEEARAQALDTVIKGLREGTPLTVICSAENMPSDDSVRVWAQQDEDIARAIARARETGFDKIAMDALDIADDNSRDTVKGRDGQEIADTEWISRSRLRVDTRLKLLAKWDPKRYGEATMLKHADADGNNLDLASTLAARRAQVAEGRDEN